MSNAEEEVTPYRYKGKFEADAKTVTVGEMDKDALQAYIRKILGVGSLNGEMKESDIS